MKALITGGTGFIGGHLMSHLGRLGYDVENLPKQEFLTEDFARLTDIRRDGSNEKPDVVIHTAWPRLASVHDPAHLEFALWSCQFLQECADNGIKVINLGSHNEYGVKYEPAHEEMLCEPIDTYGIAKLMVTLYAKKLGMNTLRLFAVYGEGGRNFKSVAAHAGKFANPTNTKDFIPVEAVCWAVERLMHGQHLYGEVINVCTGEQQAAHEIVLRLLKDSPEELEREQLELEKIKQFNLYPQRQFEPSMWVGDPEKMKRILNLDPIYFRPPWTKH